MFFGNLGMFVPVAQTVICGTYWVLLKVCKSAIRLNKPSSIVQHSDNAPYTYALSHHPYSAAVFGHETNYIRTKMYVTAVSYRDSSTDSVCLSPICEIQQKATPGSTATTNRTSEGFQPYSYSKCVCGCVCVCVCVCVCGVVWCVVCVFVCVCLA